MQGVDQFIKSRREEYTNAAELFDKVFVDLEDEIVKLRLVIETLHKELSELRNSGVAAERDAEIAERDAEIAERDAEIAERDAEIAERDAEIAERDAEIAELKIYNLRLSEELSEALTSFQDARTRLERAERRAAALDEDAVAARAEYTFDRDRAAARIVCLHGQLVEHGHVPNDEYDGADTADGVYRLKYADLKAAVDAVAEALAWHMKPHGKRAKQMPRQPAAARGSIAALWAVAETLATAVPALDAPAVPAVADAAVPPAPDAAVPPVHTKQKKRTVASVRAAAQAATQAPQLPLDMVRTIAEKLERLNHITMLTGAAADFKGSLRHRERRAVMVATRLLLQHSERVKNPDDPAKCIPGILLATCPLIAIRVWDMEEIKMGQGGKIATEAIASLDDGSVQAAGRYLLGLEEFAGNIGGGTAMHPVMLAKRRSKNPIRSAAISLLVSALREGALEPCRGGEDAPKLRDDADLLNCYVIARARCTAAAMG
jgi:hypothetical protein